MLPSEVSPMWDIINWQLAYQGQLYQQRLSIYHHPVIMHQLKLSDQMANLYVHSIENWIYSDNATYYFSILFSTSISLIIIFE